MRFYDSAPSIKSVHLYNAGCGLVILFLLFLLVLKILLILVCNVFDFETMDKFGVIPYAENIFIFNEADDAEIAGDAKVYGQVMSMAELDSATHLDTIKPDTYVHVHWEDEGDLVTWMAVSYYSGAEKKYGFVIFPNNQKPVFKPDNDKKYFEDALVVGLRKRAVNSGVLKETQNLLEMQWVKEDHDCMIVSEDEYMERIVSMVYGSKVNVAKYEKQKDDLLKQAEYVYYQNGKYEIMGHAVSGNDFKWGNPLKD